MDTGSGKPSGPPPGSSPRASTPAHTPATNPADEIPENPIKSKTLIIGAAVVIVALMAGLFVATSNGDDSPEAASAPDLANEVFLEPAQSIGTDPFFAETSELVSIQPVLIPVEPAPEGIEISAANDGQSVIEATTASANQASNGATPGLYGGTEDNSRCNRLQLVEFLEANDVKAAAWAEVQGIQPEQIREFVDTLTPVVLLKDTRVTNHGFKDGKANPIQSVLQAGTAVLVDDTGMPRARCACGNPLNKPIPQSTVRYLGPAWDSFDPGNLQIVNPGPGTETFVLQNLDGGDPFARPAGTDGEVDFAAPDGAINAIPGDINMQGELGDPALTATIGGRVTTGVIIFSDSAEDLGLAPPDDTTDNQDPPTDSSPSDEVSEADTAAFCALIDPSQPEVDLPEGADFSAELRKRFGPTIDQSLRGQIQEDMYWFIDNAEQALDEWLDNNSFFAEDEETVVTPLMAEFEVRTQRLEEYTVANCGFSAFGSE